MKLSRLSLPFNSPTRIAAKAGRVFLDVVEGVLTLRSTFGSFSVGAETVVNATTEDNAVAQSWHNAYVRKSFATANTITFPDETAEEDPVLFLPGTSFIVKNIGAGTLTLTEGPNVTINGDVSLAQGDVMKVIRIDENEWDTITLHDVSQTN